MSGRGCKEDLNPFEPLLQVRIAGSGLHWPACIFEFILRTGTYDQCSMPYRE